MMSRIVCVIYFKNDFHDQGLFASYNKKETTYLKKKHLSFVTPCLVMAV